MGLYYAQKVYWLKKVVLPLVAIVTICFSVFYNFNAPGYGDETNNYSEDCIIRLEAVRYLENNYAKTDLIKAPFLFIHAMERPLAGYLGSNAVFYNVKPLSAYEQDEGLYLFCNMEPSKYYEEVANNVELKLLQRFEKSNLWIEIYAKK